MPLSSALFSYFNACLLADQRGSLLTNVFTTKFEQRYFFTDKELLLTEEMPWYPLPEAYGEEAVAKLELYQRERDLLYCSFFLVGQAPEIGKICAPLVLVPASVKEAEEYTLRINFTQFMLNSLLLQQAIGTEQAKKIVEGWPQGAKEEDSIKLARLFEKLAPEVDVSALYTYPKLLSEKEIKSRSRTEKGLSLMPASMLSLVAQSSRGNAVSAELQKLAKQKVFSKPLEYLFAKDAVAYEIEPRPVLNSVSVLSEAQQQALENAARQTVSQITGPPGTGKSFTLANIALSQLALGRSVLVVAKTDEAANIIHAMIESLTPRLDVALRAGRSFKTELKVKFRDLLAGINNLRAVSITLDRYAIRLRLNQLVNQLIYLKEEVREELARHERWGAAFENAERTRELLARIKAWYLFNLNEYGSRTDLWAKTQALEETSQEHKELVIELIQAEYLTGLIHMVENNRDQLAKFYAALKARKSGEQQQFLDSIDFSIALAAMPIWVVTAKDIGETLPLQANLFDLVVIDEASQMDLATSLPIIQRAKRLVVAGDPMQLRHVSFLSSADQNRFKRQYRVELPNFKLDYANTSILDVVMQSLPRQEQVVLLNEHFRSHPEIINFSNRTFYNGELHIMKNRPDSHLRFDEFEGLNFFQVEGEDVDRSNHKEAQELINTAATLITREKALPAEGSSSIGFLSPFRNQVELLGKLVVEKFSREEIKKHRIQIGTPYSFQGEEKDHMLLSMVLTDSSNATAWRYAGDSNVLNVAITRAKKSQIVFYSFAKRKAAKNYLNDYVLDEKANLAHSQKAETKNWNRESYDEFADDVARQLEALKIPVYVAQKVAGLEVDLILRNNSVLYGIGLIGYPGASGQVLTTEELERLKRAGVAVMPLPYVTWKLNRTLCLNQLYKFTGKKTRIKK